MGFSKHLLFALLGSVAHALPGTAADQAGPGGGGRGGKGAGPGAGAGGGGSARGGKSGGGGGRASDPNPGPNWKQFLDLDKVHPLCPSDLPEVLFYDNFATYSPGSQPSRSKWQYDIGHSYPGGPENWGTGEIQYYTDDPANIVITAQRELRITPLKDDNDEWTSARIETTREWDFAAEPGKKVRIQAVIKLGDEDPDNQLGIWPAFWSLGSGYRDNYESWPSVGEIDILESPNGLPLAWQVLHCGPAYNAAYPCNEPDGIASIPPNPFSRGVWHVVSVDIDRTNPSGRWQDEEIVWRIDGEIVFQVSGEEVGSKTYWTNISNGDHMILLNVAVGGSFPNKLVGFNPDDPNSPPPTPRENTVGGIHSSMWVKYVIAYGN